MIAADRFTLNDDGTAWLVDADPVLGLYVWPDLDRPCDNPFHYPPQLEPTELDTPCLIWTGRLNSAKEGYGRFPDGRLVHRMTWEEANGFIPAGMVVMHRCDNPACYEITHLRLGTRAENNADRDAKGRNRRPTQKGEVHSNAKLSDADVAVILASDEPATVIGPRYGVLPDHIRRLRRGDARTETAPKCPADCIDGRHTFDIEVESTGVLHNFPEGAELIHRYRVSIFPGMVLEIVEWNGRPTGYPWISGPSPGGAFVLHHIPRAKAERARVDLPSAAARGMWAVKLRVAS